jgi:EAL domain-containing protein (putative c-di-GMP-specific phosphodiesterase class I)
MPSNRAVTQAIVQMARAMSKRVVAEGVETVDERDCLLALGCREIQGYLYSKPVSFEELRSLVAQVGVADGSQLGAASPFDPEHWEIEPLSAAARS